MTNKAKLGWVSIPILCTALGAASAGFAQQSQGESSGREISIVIEEGDRVPAQVLDEIAARELGSATENVVFSVLEGEARLAGTDGQTVAAGGGFVDHAEIVAGSLYDESYVGMTVNGQLAGRPIRIGTIAGESLHQLLAKDVPAGSEALLAKSTDYAVVDTGLLRSKSLANPVETPTGEYCAAIFDQERDVYGDSRVLGRGCSDQSDEDALVEAQSNAPDSHSNPTRILNLHQHAGWGGRGYAAYGCCGICDSAGYKFYTWSLESFFAWNSQLSSTAKAPYSYCNYVHYMRSTDGWWSAARALNDYYVGDYYNDNIARVHVHW